MFFSNNTALGDGCRFRCGGIEWARAFFAHILCSRVLCLVILLSTGVSATAWADVGKAGEYQVKAAFIMNFMNFIEWPDNALPADTITIGILGRDPSAGAIDALKGKTVKGRQVIIRHYDDPEEARNAALLFISPSEKRALPLIFKNLRNRPVLTVGDQQGFARAGVMINMVLVRKKVGFEINLPASHRAGIRISSQLLKLAKEVVE
ncbi:MAG: YfiR family protein [Geobacteraceae bacterium]|nr:YfiR family protein [Geobacteraceae bacterium]